MKISGGFAVRWCLTSLAAALLVGCGGGGGGSGGSSATNDAATVPGPLEARSALGAAALFDTVKVTPSADGSAITTSPALKDAAGNKLTRLEDLPDAIAGSTWMSRPDPRPALHVVFEPGVYRLGAPWVWLPKHSGKAGSPIILEARIPGSVVISGGRSFVLSRAAHNGAKPVTFDLSALPAGTVIEQAWVNDQRAIRARTPNAGQYFQVRKAVATLDGATDVSGISVDRWAFLPYSRDRQSLSGLTPDQLQSAVLVAMHSWTPTFHRVSEVDAYGQIRLTAPTPWAFRTNVGVQRYFIDNIESGLDAEREWFHSPTSRTLRYIGTAAELAGDLTLDVPLLPQLLQIQGDVSKQKWVEYLQFDGLSFSHSAYVMPATGVQDAQAAASLGAAIVVDGARHIAFQNGQISHTGAHGIWLRNNVRQVSVLNNEIYDTGAGAIKIGTASLAADGQVTGDNLVQGNRIHATGLQHAGATAIWIGQSDSNVVEDNLIGDTTYSGISVGWTWGYGTSQAANNHINRNYLYDIMQGVLNDGGAIYTLGSQPGTEIKGNVIKNVRGYNNYGRGAWGIYNDEGSSNMVVDGNIVLGSDTGGYMLHYGQNLSVSNNVFAQGDTEETDVAKAETGLQLTFTGNKLFPLSLDFMPWSGAAKPNLVTQGNVVSRQYAALSTVSSLCGTGCTLDDTVTLDPGLPLAVPTVKAKGVSVPMNTASDMSGVKLKAAVSPAAIWRGSLGTRFDASQLSLSETAPGLVSYTGDATERIKVMKAATGEKCLAFVDDAGLADSWFPYGVLMANYATGTTHLNFTFLADSTTEFVLEWRDSTNASYRIGPALTLSAARGVMVRSINKQVGPLPVGQWITVDIDVTQGAQASWGVTVTYADGTKRQMTGLAPYTPGWQATRALYWVSAATVASRPCVGQWTLGQ